MSRTLSDSLSFSLYSFSKTSYYVTHLLLFTVDILSFRFFKPYFIIDLPCESVTLSLLQTRMHVYTIEAPIKNDITVRFPSWPNVRDYCFFCLLSICQVGEGGDNTESPAQSPKIDCLGSFCMSFLEAAPPEVKLSVVISKANNRIQVKLPLIFANFI